VSNFNEYCECDYKVDTNDDSNILFKKKLTSHIEADNSFCIQLAMPKRVMMIIKLKPWKVILTNYKIVT
jgi:hypothetical protein